MPFRLRGTSPGDKRPRRAGQTVEQSASETNLAMTPRAAEPTPRRLIPSEDVVMLNSPRSAAAEVFRRLNSLLFREDEDTRIIVVTSSTAGDGKTVIASNLALTCAMYAQANVVLVD